MSVNLRRLDMFEESLPYTREVNLEEKLHLQEMTMIIPNLQVILF